MSTTVSQIRDGLVAAIQQIPDLAVERTWPGQINPPSALLRVTGIDYAEAFDGMNLFHVEVTLLVRVAQLASGHEELDEYVDPTGERSLAYFLELDQSLDGISDVVNCLRMHDYGDLLIGGVTYLGAVFDVDVYAT